MNCKDFLGGLLMDIKVKDVLLALDDLTSGRCLKDINDENLFSMTKDSTIFGKKICERPGLVWGNPEMKVNKIAVMMTMTESAIELAAATGVNAIVAHHPLADAASSGGVLLKTYLDIYNLAAFELHEAFHGLHPGIPWLHGHSPIFTHISYGDIHGNIVYVGDVLDKIETIGDMFDRLDKFMNYETDKKMLELERDIRNSPSMEEACIAARRKIIIGSLDSKMKQIIHIFPHTGFTAEHLEEIYKEYPDVDTVLMTISRVYEGNELIAKCRELGLNLICGNSHALEIYENGIPMAHAIKNHLPEVEVVVFQDRLLSIPLEEVGSKEIRDYGKNIADKYLFRKDC